MSLGNVSPSKSDIATATARPEGLLPLVLKAWARVEHMVEVGKDVASYVVPADTAGITAEVAEGFSHRTLHFGTCPVHDARTLFPLYDTVASGTRVAFTLLPVFPVDES